MRYGGFSIPLLVVEEMVDVVRLKVEISFRPSFFLLQGFLLPSIPSLTPLPLNTLQFFVAWILSNNIDVHQRRLNRMRNKQFFHTILTSAAEGWVYGYRAS